MYGCSGEPEDLIARAQLDDAPEVHHRHPIAEVLDHGEVVGHEEQREVEATLEVAQQVQDLALDRHVEGRDGLVGDEEPGLHRERAGDPDALALAARELMGVPAVVVALEPDQLERLVDAVRRDFLRHAVGRADPRRWSRRSWRGDRARRTGPGRPPASGCAARARRRPWRRARRRRRSVMVPLSASSSRSRTRPSVDLPQPDSPTSPSTSPARMSRSTPSTARTAPLVRPNDPDLTGNVFTTPLAFTSTLPPAGPRRGGLAHRFAPCGST